VKNGEPSAYALSDEEFARRVTPRTAAEMEADASFKLAVWFHERGNQAMAGKYWQRAQQLNPDDLELPPPGVELHPARGGQEVAREVRQAGAALLSEAGDSGVADAEEVRKPGIAAI
jgi:hypothetical protein